MIDVGQRRIVRIAPAFGVEMQTKHKIGMQFEVYPRSAATDLAVAVEQNFALPADRLLFFRIIWIKNFPAHARLWYAAFDQNFPGELPKIIRALGRGRFIAVSNKRNARPEFAQSRRQQSRHAQRQITLLHRLAVADLKPALLHLRPFPTEMTRIERDLQT